MDERRKILVVDDSMDYMTREVRVSIQKEGEWYDFCKGCKLYPCFECDDDTTIIDCDHKEKEK
jgi:hypothetical protein